MGYVIGCDIGSQSAKAVLMSPGGQSVTTATANYSMTHPRSGWAEQNPADYRESLTRVTRQVVRDAGISGREVSHLAFSSQVDGFVPIDRHLRPLRDAIIWLDRRATHQVRRIEEKIDPAELFGLTGLNLNASHTGPKMMWLADHEPTIYHAATSLPSVGGYAVAWLTGRSIQDHANSSSTLLYDLTARAWSDALLGITGLDGAKLPEIAEAHEIAGTLTPEAADSLGLTTTCAVVVGTGDDHAACLGAGGIRPGIVVDILGTAEPVGVASDAPVFDDTRLVETHAHAVAGGYLIENPGFVSGGNTLWFGHNVLGVSQEEFFERAARSVPGANGVRFVPALSGAMAPRWRDHMRGSFSNLGMNHDSADLARSIVEANAFAFRDIHDRLHALGLAESVRVVGGGTRSDLWLTIKATVCGVPIRRVSNPEPSATGAALLAAVAAGIFPDLTAAVDEVIAVDPVPIEPDPGWHGAYEDAYLEYRAVFDALEPIYQEAASRDGAQ